MIQRKELGMTFSLGAVLGLLCFLVIYGSKVLDVRYDAWLLTGGDLTQHYLGWCLFRESPWTFPIGLTPEYAWPCEISVIYSDAIPLCAILFKTLSPLLPETFQYFGYWGLFCYALQGGFAAILLRRFLPSVWLSAFLSLFFLVSYQIMTRMFGHAALGAQWVLLLALIFLFCWEWISDRMAWRMIWGGMGVLCVWVHGYFAPMVFLIMLTSLYMHLWKQGEKKECSILVTCYLFGVIASMWILGAFSFSFASSVTDMGIYSANLDSFFNPLNNSSKFMPCFNIPDGQYEGGFYLGAGAIALVFFAFGKTCWNFSRGKRIGEGYFPVIFLGLTCILIAILPKICFHDSVLFTVDIPIPTFLSKIFTIFRSHGRFIWIPAYLLLLFSIVTMTGTCKTDILHPGEQKRVSCPIGQWFLRFKIGIMAVLTMSAIQIADFSGFLTGLHQYYASNTGHNILNGYETVDELMKHHQYVVYTDYSYTNTNIGLMISYYAYKNNVKMEAFYLARMPDQHLQQTQKEILSELEEGSPRKDTLYVIVDRESAKRYRDLVYYEVNELLLGSSTRVEMLQ